MSEKEVCDICNKTVTDDDEGLLCDNCMIWKHRNCLSISKKTYQKIGKSKEDWLCNQCKSKFTEKVTQNKNDYTIADVMAKLDDMDKKYNKLYQLYNNQLKINEELTGEISYLKNKLNNIEQKELNKNLIVQGVPYEMNENIIDIVKNIHSELQIPMNDQDFTAFRIGNDSVKQRPIKVIFSNEENKLKIMKSPRKIFLNTHNLGFSTSNKIYLNHDMTKNNMDLFEQAQVYKKDNGYKYLWFNNGNILMRKDENGKVMLIKDVNDLKN